MSMLTYRYRNQLQVPPAHIGRMAGAINYVWNFCKLKIHLLAFRRDKTFLSAYDLHKLTVGTSKDLRLSADTIAIVLTEYVTRRKQFKKITLKWRSKKRSLGWMPFKAAYMKLEGDTVTYCGHRFRLWLSRPIEGTVKTGSFTQDARGRWYVNLQCEVADATEPVGQTDLGIDLGLINQIACSDGVIYSRENLTHTHEIALAMAQRAGKRSASKRSKPKSPHTKDWTHKATPAIARRAKYLVIGDVSSAKLVIKTPFAKSTLDAAWYGVRFQSSYKANRLAGVCAPGAQRAGLSVTCSDRGARTGPSGLTNAWRKRVGCMRCGVTHNRDVR